ncbi:hypothetical protein ACJX0J_029557, partial [Zea mays]
MQVNFHVTARGMRSPLSLNQRKIRENEYQPIFYKYLIEGEIVITHYPLIMLVLIGLCQIVDNDFFLNKFSYPILHCIKLRDHPIFNQYIGLCQVVDNDHHAQFDTEIWS